MADVPLHVISIYAASERRITPSWSISQLKTKLETVTGIPPSCQRISLKTPAAPEKIPVEAADEDTTYLSSFPLVPYAELHDDEHGASSLAETGRQIWESRHPSQKFCSARLRGANHAKLWLSPVDDTRPPAARPNFDASGVERYVMPEEEYEKKTDSVLAWKKAQKLGRFDPDAPSQEAAKLKALSQEIASRGIEAGKRCRVGGDDSRRGEVKYVGDVKEIPNGAGAWVGIQLDEPVGKNDGSINGNRYWGSSSELKHGVFVRPERVEIGDYPALDDLEDMEEI